MNKLDLLIRVNNAISELESIRKELLSDYPEWLDNMTMKQLLDGKASVRLLNVMKYRNMDKISVTMFVQIVKHSDMLAFHGVGKLTMLELSKIIKDETGINW